MKGEEGGSGVARDELRKLERDRDQEKQDSQRHKNPGDSLRDAELGGDREIERQTERKRGQFSDVETLRQRNTDKYGGRGNGWGCCTAVNARRVGKECRGPPLPSPHVLWLHLGDTLVSPHSVALNLLLAPINPDLRAPA